MDNERHSGWKLLVYVATVLMSVLGCVVIRRCAVCCGGYDVSKQLLRQSVDDVACWVEASWDDFEGVRHWHKLERDRRPMAKTVAGTGAAAEAEAQGVVPGGSVSEPARLAVRDVLQSS